MFKNLARARPGALRAAALSLGFAFGLALGPTLSLAQGVGVPTQAKSGSAAKPVGKAGSTAPLKVAFVYVSPIGSAGWTYQHDQGRLGMEQALGSGLKTTVVENVAEGPDSERVMRDLAAQGNRLIFATSFGYLEPALKVAQEFPAVAFEHMGGYKTAANVNTYNARFYEGRYLAGLVAGKMSKTGRAGYVAGFPIPEVVQGINAFTLGMRAANPKATVQVVWLNTWFDPAKEREAAQTLINDGVDMLTHHSGSTAIPVLAEENAAKGVRLLGYQSDMRAIAPKAQLTSVTHHWSDRYTAVARAVQAGTWTAQPFWGGVKNGVIRLAPFSAEVPTTVVQQVRDAERAIATGRLQPFGGKITDQAGAVRKAAGPMADADLAVMNYFVAGVAGSLPR